MHYVYDPAVDHAFANFVLAGAALSLVAFCVAFVCLLRAWRRAQADDPSIYILQERLHQQGMARARRNDVRYQSQTSVIEYTNADDSGNEEASVRGLELLQARLMMANERPSFDSVSSQVSTLS